MFFLVGQLKQLHVNNKEIGKLILLGHTKYVSFSPVGVGGGYVYDEL